MANQIGRPSKLTPERQEKLIQAIKAGNHLNVACAYAGIDYSNFRMWMRKGEAQKSGSYRDFHDAVKLAEAELEVKVVANWQKEIPNNWKAAESFLSKRFPDRWRGSNMDLLQAIKVFVEMGIAPTEMLETVKEGIGAIEDGLREKLTKDNAAETTEE